MVYAEVNWDEFVHYQRTANVVYAEAGRQFIFRSRDVLMYAQCRHKWWATLKSAVFGSSSDSSLSLTGGEGGGGLVGESVGKAEILLADFDGKKSRDPVDLPSTCLPSPSLTTFAFRSREVRRLLLDLDSYGGTDPLGIFTLFVEEDSCCSDPSSRCGISAAPSFGQLSCFAGECLMSQKFQRVHLPPQWPITNQFP